MAHPTKEAKQHTATLIFLHGLGDTGHGWLDGFSQICAPHVKIICPNAPTQAVTLNFGMQMPSWFDIKALTFDAEEDEVGIKQSSDVVKKIIEDEEKLGIPTNRIVVGGFSQGGAVGLNTFVTLPKKLAGCIGLSTFLPLHKQFPGSCAAENKDTKVFIGHGTSDPVVKYVIGQKTKEVLKSHYSNTKFNSYNGLGHSSSPKEMKDVSDFLKSVLPKSD